MQRLQRILIIRNSALGDVAMTLPVLYSLAHNYPDSEFYLLTRPFFARIFVNRPPNLHIIEADYKGEHKGIKGLVRLIKSLSKYNFTAVADLHNVLRSWVIDACMRLSGKRVAMVDKKRSHRLTAASRSDQQSFIQRYKSVFNRLGFDFPLDFRTIYPERSNLARPKVSKPAVGVAPFARYINKTYPIELMRQVVTALTERGINVYLYGAKGAEAETLDAWAAEIDGCTSFAGKMPIEDELETMSQMDVMISMDSANQHLASIVGTPVVSIWGSTMPGCGFYGYNQHPDNAIYRGITCQPCTVAGSKTCKRGDMPCLTGLSPQIIVDKVIALIAKAK